MKLRPAKCSVELLLAVDTVGFALCQDVLHSAMFLNAPPPPHTSSHQYHDWDVRRKDVTQDEQDHQWTGTVKPVDAKITLFHTRIPNKFRHNVFVDHNVQCPCTQKLQADLGCG